MTVQEGRGRSLTGGVAEVVEALNSTSNVDKMEPKQDLPPLCVKQTPGNCRRFHEAGPNAGQEPLVRAEARKTRMLMEYNVYREWEAVLGEDAGACLPRVFRFTSDEEGNSLVMESLVGYRSMDEILREGELDIRSAAGLGAILGAIHGRTHSAVVSADEAKRLAEAFVNQELRAVQLAHILSIDAVASQKHADLLRRDADFCRELEELRLAYQGERSSEGGLALCHGDLQPGGLATEEKSGRVKLVDPEFAVYAPPGFDLGVMIASYLLFALHRFDQRFAGCRTALTASRQLWTTYQVNMGAAGIDATLLNQASADATGFACLRVMAFAFAEDSEDSAFPSLQGKSRAKSLDVLLGVLQQCVKSRKEGGLEMMLEEFAKFDATSRQKKSRSLSSCCHM